MPTREKKETGRAKTARCPECGEKYSPQGLVGHLRFHHGKGVKNVKTAQRKAVSASRKTAQATETLTLAKHLREIGKEIEEVDSLFPNAEDKLVLAALKNSKRALLKRLAQLAPESEEEEEGDDFEEESDDEDDEL